MTELSIHDVAPVRSRRRALRRWLARLLSARAEAKARQRCLAKLAEYDDRLLDDVGLTRKQATGQHSWPAWAVADPWGR